MPFTFAHPAAAVPLLRPLGRYGSLSALVLGSLAPDLAYFLPITVEHHQTHGALALLGFCLPTGVLSYVLFHLLLKQPLLGLLPTAVLQRLGPGVVLVRPLRTVPWSAVIISVLCGAATHIVWDSLTHAGTPVVRALPILQVQLFSLGGYRVYFYKLLQHGSTCAGLLLLGWWAWRWLRQAVLLPVILPVNVPPGLRVVAIVMIVGIPVAMGLCAGLQAYGASSGAAAMQAFAGRAVVSTLSALGLTLTGFSLAWQVWRAWMRRTGAAGPV